MVLYAFAVFTICESIGILSPLSQMIRTGLFSPGIRTFNIGSSARTVPIPAMIPIYWWRSSCTFFLALSPVIHLESPVRAAIFPSAVMAYFMTT